MNKPKFKIGQIILFREYKWWTYNQYHVTILKIKKGLFGFKYLCMWKNDVYCDHNYWVETKYGWKSEKSLIE